mgnify:FL=1
MHQSNLLRDRRVGAAHAEFGGVLSVLSSAGLGAAQSRQQAACSPPTAQYGVSRRGIQVGSINMKSGLVGLALVLSGPRRAPAMEQPRRSEQIGEVKSVQQGW